MRVFSHERTKIAYDGTPEANDQGLPEGVHAGQRVVLEHGWNELTPAGAALLAQDVNFKRHADDKHVYVEPETAAEPEAPAVPPVKLTAAQKKTVEGFYGLSEADRAAMYPALSDDEKALVDADPRAKAAV